MIVLDCRVKEKTLKVINFFDLLNIFKKYLINRLKTIYLEKDQIMLNNKWYDIIKYNYLYFKNFELLYLDNNKKFLIISFVYHLCLIEILELIHLDMYY